MLIGIELGTRQVSAAWVGPNGSPQLVPDKHDAEIFYTPLSLCIEGGRVFVGRAAEVVAEDNPTAPAARNIKLSLGSTEPVLQDSRQRPWLAETALATVLHKLLDDAAVVGGARPKLGVITVPHEFTPVQRAAVARAADWAGLSTVLLLDRGLAAARFLAASNDGPAPRLALVVTAGASFSEVALVEVGPRTLKTRALKSARLGGSDLDDALLQALRPVLGDHVDDPAARRQLSPAVGQLRRRLAKAGASDAATVIFLRGRPYPIFLLAGQYDRIVEPLVRRLVGLADAVLQEAGVPWNQVDAVWPVAGSALESGVVKALSAKFGRAVQPRQPLQAAVFGAAWHAADLAAGTAWEGLPRLPGRRGSSLALRMVDPEKKVRLDELIPAGTPRPAHAAKRYALGRADQIRMVFDLVFSDDAGIESAALLAFGPIPKPQANLSIDLQVSLCAQGMLAAEAVDTSTGNKLPRSLLTRGISSEPLVNQRVLLEGLRHG